MFANGFVAPESFTLTVSFAFLAAVVVGGLATVAGAVFGALFIVFVPVWSSDVDEALSGVIYGAALIACMYVFRGGIMGLLRSGSRLVEVKGQPTGGATMRSLRWLWLMLIAVLALVPAACGRDDDGGGGGGGGAKSDPGITDKEIKLGGSYPFSGPASAYGTIGEGAKAYFKFLNAKGGVNGRKIDFITLDDGYEPPKALQNARRLVQQDKVFAMFNTLGTPNNLAIWDFLNEQKVPQLYVATGASAWGADIKAHPYTIGWQPNYVTEAKVYADYLKKEKPNAKVAVLYQNDGFGKDLLGGFEEGDRGLRHQGRQEGEPTTSPTRPSRPRWAGSRARGPTPS